MFESPKCEDNSNNIENVLSSRSYFTGNKSYDFAKKKLYFKLYKYFTLTCMISKLQLTCISSNFLTINRNQTATQKKTII